MRCVNRFGCVPTYICVPEPSAGVHGRHCAYCASSRVFCIMVCGSFSSFASIANAFLGRSPTRCHRLVGYLYASRSCCHKDHRRSRFSWCAESTVSRYQYGCISYSASCIDRACAPWRNCVSPAKSCYVVVSVLDAASRCSIAGSCAPPQSKARNPTFDRPAGSVSVPLCFIF